MRSWQCVHYSFVVEKYTVGVPVDGLRHLLRRLLFDSAHDLQHVAVHGNLEIHFFPF